LKKAELETSIFDTEEEAEIALKKLISVNPAFNNASIERSNQIKILEKNNFQQ